MHPSFKFKPLGRSARKIPLSQYNGIGKVAQRVSGLGIDGFGAEDLEAERRGRVTPELFVRVRDTQERNADVLYWTGSAWEEDTQHFITIASLVGPLPLVPRRTRLWVKWHHQGGVWLPKQWPIVRFELDGELDREGSASAFLLEQYGDGLTKNSDVRFTVHDGIDVFEYDFKSTEDADASSARGYAVWWDDLDRYEIIQMGC